MAISSLADMERLFEGIPLEDVSTSMTINSTAAILLAFYALVARRQGADRRKLSGTIQNDILKEYIARGTYIYPPRPAMRIITDIFAWAGREMPEWNTISISGYHIREAGSTAVQELAFTFANAIAYIEAAIAAGLAVDSFAPRLSFFFNSHSDFLEEIAKFRAARRIYASLMRDRFGAKDPRSHDAALPRADGRLDAHRAAARREHRAHRAAGDGGGAGRRAIAAHQFARRGAVRCRREESARIALRTQQIIAHESGRDQHGRPGRRQRAHRGADGYDRARRDEYLKRIDEMGGTLRAIETGYIQNEIQNAAYEWQRAVETGRARGGGRQSLPAGRGARDPRPSAWTRRSSGRRSKGCAQVRASRSAVGRDGETDGARSRRRAATANLMPAILEAAGAHATVGEISDRLRAVFGEHRETRSQGRATEIIERPCRLSTLRRIWSLPLNSATRRVPLPVAQAETVHDTADVVGIVAHAEARVDGLGEAHGGPAVGVETRGAWSGLVDLGDARAVGPPKGGWDGPARGVSGALPHLSR